MNPRKNVRTERRWTKPPIEVHAKEAGNTQLFERKYRRVGYIGERHGKLVCSGHGARQDAMLLPRGVL